METSANLGTLPVEISYLICEYLYESSFKCLFSMSLTCQSLNIATQPLMFRNVTLRISNSQELGRILDMAASRIKDIVQRYTRSIEIRRKAMIVEEGMHDLDTQNFGETPDLSDYDAYNDYVVGDEEALCAMSIWKPLPGLLDPGVECEGVDEGVRRSRRPRMEFGEGEEEDRRTVVVGIMERLWPEVEEGMEWEDVIHSFPLWERGDEA